MTLGFFLSLPMVGLTAAPLQAERLHCLIPLKQLSRSNDKTVFDPVGAGRSEMRRYISILKDPSMNREVKIEKLMDEIQSQLDETEMLALILQFNTVLEMSTEMGKNRSATANLEHIYLHYHYALKFEKEIGQVFVPLKDRNRQPPILPLLLLQSAHDLGKIVEGFKGGELISERTKAFLTDTIAKDGVNFRKEQLNRPDGLRGEALELEIKRRSGLMRAVLAHGELSMEAVEVLVEAFGNISAWDKAKTIKVTKLIQSGISRHNGGYGSPENNSDKKLFHWWSTHYKIWAHALNTNGVSAPLEDPAIIVADRANPKSEGQDWGNALLTYFDRGSQLHSSFYMKALSTADGRSFEPKALASMMEENVQTTLMHLSILEKELQKQVVDGSRFSESEIARHFRKMAENTLKVAEKLRLMDDWPSEFKKPNGLEMEAILKSLFGESINHFQPNPRSIRDRFIQRPIE